MRSAQPSDRTARAAILEESLRLFAERGEDAVTMRQIAEAAEVSPALVVHHFGSKAGLRQAVVERVTSWMDGLIDASQDVGLSNDIHANDWGSLSDLAREHLPPGSPVLGYLRRLFLSGDPAATEMLRRWHTRSVEVMQQWVRAGELAATDDETTRTALLMSTDLGLLLLAPHWERVLGYDPLGDGMERWAIQSFSTFAAMFPQPVDPPQASPPSSGDTA